MKKFNRTTWLATAGVIACASLGLVAGGAFAAGAPALFSPAGLSPAEGIPDQPKPEPSYAVNANGETFGSLADATSPETEPDLIQAVANNGQYGYVKKAELDAANGTTAAESFRSPADALAWQEQAIARGDQLIPVYAEDGVTVIGDFMIAAPDPQYITVEDGLTPEG